MSGKTDAMSDRAGQKSDVLADDAALQLKKKARRRLVGAIALVLFAVITLPMVMDHQPRPVAPEIQVRIPSQDGPGFSGRIAPGGAIKSTPLPPVASSSPAKTEAANAAANAAAEAKPKTASLPDAVPGKSPAATSSQTVDKPPAADAVAADTHAAAKPVAKPAGKPAEANKNATKPADDPRALAALSATGGANGGGDATAASTGRWIVQLGAYKEAGNVKLLTAKIKEMRIPVYSENFDSPQGARTRVRAGPFATRDAAEKAQSRIRSIGVEGSVAPQ